MSAPSRSLREHLSTRSRHVSVADPSWVQSPLHSALRTMVEAQPLVLITGPPRTGKSSLALGVAEEIESGSQTRFAYTYVLDLIRIREPEEEFQHIPSAIVGASTLLLVDEWHARDDCHDGFARFFARHRQKSTCVVILATRTSESGGTLALPAGLAAAAPQVPTLDTEDSVLAVASGMVRVHFERHGYPLTAEGEEQVAMALSYPFPARIGHANLRALSWRLEAWNPAHKDLREVSDADILDVIERTLIRPAGAHIGTLERVASLSQWEVPLEREVGQDVPAGMDHLVRAGLAFAVREQEAWKMDPTDARLTLWHRHRDDWLKASIESLRKVRLGSPQAMANLAWQVLQHPDRQVRVGVLSGLPAEEELFACLSERLLAHLQSNTAGLQQLKRALEVLMDNLPTDPHERAERIRTAQAFLRGDLLAAAGAIARSRSLQSTMWLLSYLKRGAPELNAASRVFLDAIGEQSLVGMINAHQSPFVQATVMRLVRGLASDLGQRIGPRVSLKPMPLGSMSPSQRMSWLSVGTVQWGRHRADKIEVLEQLDADDLERLCWADHRPMNRAQVLLSTAMWLSPDDARRLGATLVSQLPMPLPADKSSDLLSRFVMNLRAVSPESATEVVDRIIAFAGEVVFRALDAKEVGYLLLALEKCTPGAVDQVVAEHREQWLRCVALENQPISTLLGTLLLLPKSVKRETLEVIAGARNVSHGSIDAWAWRGALAMEERLAGHATPSASLTAQDVASALGTDWLLGIYGMQCEGGNAAVGRLLQSLSSHRLRDPFLPITIARHVLPWTPEAVTTLVRHILRLGGSPRTQGVRNIAIIGNVHGTLRWPVERRFDYRNDRHRAVCAAADDGLLRTPHRMNQGIMMATFRDDHPIVATIREALEHVTRAMASGAWRSLEELDEAIGSALTTEEKDYWLGKLVWSGAASWRCRMKDEGFAIEFALDRERNESEVERLVLGEAK